MLNAVITGNFDGFHIGHQKLVTHFMSEAKSLGMKPLLLTFEPHPKTHFSGLKRLTPFSELKSTIESLFDIRVVSESFDDEFRMLSGQQYIQQILREKHEAGMWMVGFDHRFGYKAQSTVREELEFLQSTGILHREGIEYQDKESRKYSSSYIREFLESGKLKEAHQMLGRPYELTGEVIHGDKIGRTLGFPTANLELPEEKLIPAPGVYGVEVGFEGPQSIQNAEHTWFGVMNVGNRPTFQSAEPRVEVHILDFHEKIYGQTLSVKLTLRIRNEIKFGSPQKLREQIEKDISMAKRFFSTHN